MNIHLKKRVLRHEYTSRETCIKTLRHEYTSKETCIKT